MTTAETAAREQFSRNLAAARKRKGLTQRELAEAIGVRVITVSRWERGLYAPFTDTLIEAASVLGTTAAKLIR